MATSIEMRISEFRKLKMSNHPIILIAYFLQPPRTSPPEIFDILAISKTLAAWSANSSSRLVSTEVGAYGSNPIVLLHILFVLSATEELTRLLCGIFILDILTDEREKTLLGYGREQLE